AGPRVEREAADGAPLFPIELPDLVDRVEPPPAGVEREERRVDHLRGHAHGVERARRRVEAVEVDALAVRTRVGADVDEHLPGRVCSGRTTRRLLPRRAGAGL